MADKKHVLRLSKDCFNLAEISQEYFSPLCEFSAANECLSSPIEYFSPTCATPETMKKEFLYETPNSNAFKTPKKIFDENENNDSPNSTFVSEMDVRPKYYNNNVSPAIEKIVRMMKMPISSTPEKSQTPTKRVFSSYYHFVGKAIEDPAICALVKKRLDASFSSPKAHAVISRVDSPTLKVTREVEPLVPQMVQAPSRNQEFVDSDDERVDSPRYKEIIYVSEVHFLLMASNRNRRRRMAASHIRRSDSRDSAFCEGSDQEYLDGEVHQQ